MAQLCELNADQKYCEMLKVIFWNPSTLRLSRAQVEQKWKTMETCFDQIVFKREVPDNTTNINYTDFVSYFTSEEEIVGPALWKLKDDDWKSIGLEMGTRMKLKDIIRAANYRNKIISIENTSSHLS